ncbi:hypothetical protein P168DRAFT_280007 [Aspergillus campestris IBT 28561]|uniref:DNA-directed RNA polymerase I subunit RPA34.5-domain-containing protein n=1 Tax=Aspergillus campestris (strain IBT 28561) TaxID=1392248 RepID=A0A2I1D9Q6_ASPC2|nr:uncharacterized protein P168DRAFT_280007 [Aspergillus campestris IBT 28561]PKY06596.1 hypothetical protein P168DRAFT_280007 [Aspergillus campestris IBT 28561]
MAAKKSARPPTPESSSSASSRSSSPETTKKSTKPEESDDSSSEDDSAGSSGSDSSSSEDEKQDHATNGQSKDKHSSKLAFLPPQPYKPPTGFKAVKKQSPPSSTTTSLLSDLRGKQVFHVTAPSFLPIHKVKEISLAKALQGEPILTHDGVQYGIPADSTGQDDTAGKSLALYDPKTQTYRPSPATNIKSFHVQELIHIPARSQDADHDVVLEAAREQVKPPRKQPSNLKMRFRPVGSGDAPAETLGSSDDESDAEQQPARTAREEKKKRKLHQAEEEESLPAAGLPRKKSKKISSSQDAGDGEKVKKSSKSREEKKQKKSKKSA